MVLGGWQRRVGLAAVVHVIGDCMDAVAHKFTQLRRESGKGWGGQEGSETEVMRLPTSSPSYDESACEVGGEKAGGDRRAMQVYEIAWMQSPTSSPSC